MMQACCLHLFEALTLLVNVTDKKYCSVLATHHAKGILLTVTLIAIDKAWAYHSKIVRFLE
jgi:hypothetical protein